MVTYQIVRIQREACRADANVQHIVAVATGDATLYRRVWQPAEIEQEIELGASFYTRASDGHRYPAHCDRCAICGQAEVILQRFDGPETIASPHW